MNVMVCIIRSKYGVCMCVIIIKTLVQLRLADDNVLHRKLLNTTLNNLIIFYIISIFIRNWFLV